MFLTLPELRGNSRARRDDLRELVAGRRSEHGRELATPDTSRSALLSDGTDVETLFAGSRVRRPARSPAWARHPGGSLGRARVVRDPARRIESSPAKS